MGRCWQYLQRHNGALAAPSSAEGRRHPHFRLHEGRRQYASGRKAPGSTSGHRPRHHARHHVGRQQCARPLGATCGCMAAAQRGTGGTFVYTKVAGTHSSTRRWPQYASRLRLNPTVVNPGKALPRRPGSGLTQQWLTPGKALPRRPGSGLTQQWLTPVKPSHGGPAQA